MTLCDLSHNITDVQFTVPPAVHASFWECPVSGKPTSLQSWQGTFQNVRFLLEDNVLNKRVTGLTVFGEKAAFFEGMQILDASIAELAPLWTRHLFDRHASADIDSITETVDGVFEAISQLGPNAIDLRHVSPDQIQGEHLAAVLRTTAIWQDQTPGWKQAVKVAEIALKNTGIESKDALFGLI